MSEVKEVKETEDVERVAKEAVAPKSLSVEDILNQYPIDREKVRDIVTLEISKSLTRIAASLEVLPQALLGITQKLENLSKRDEGV